MGNLDAMKCESEERRGSAASLALIHMLGPSASTVV
jgi:hypothetical protein